MKNRRGRPARGHGHAENDMDQNINGDEEKRLLTGSSTLPPNPCRETNNRKNPFQNPLRKSTAAVEAQKLTKCVVWPSGHHSARVR